MLRDIFTNKWILGGIGFLTIFLQHCNPHQPARSERLPSAC